MRFQATALTALAALLLTSCGGGGSSGSSATATPTPSPTPAAVYTPPAQEALSVADVQQILAQAVGEAQAQGLPSIIAVTDRVGNVLGVFKMNGARPDMTTSDLNESGVAVNPPIDAQGLDVDATMGAISKALTGAYLSSAGNAFSTRTASEIIQANFPPAPSTVGLESGPLSGVQFSQLPCSDFNTRFNAAATTTAMIGPKRAPLGLAADPGGFPLYKNGVVVGAIGVMGDGDYGFEANVLDLDVDREEIIALAGTQGFAAPDAITADKIAIDGTTLIFSNADTTSLHPLNTNYAAISGIAGNLIPVTGYTSGAIIPGIPYGSEASGFRLATSSDFIFPDAYVLSDGSGNNRYPIRGGTDGAVVSQPLSATEVRAVLEEAYRVMEQARGQIRKPLNSPAEVTISLVDTYGAVLGMVLAPDAPIFGSDVSLQKARTVAFFSNPVAAQQMQADPDAEIPDFLTRAQTFFSDPNAFTGKIAFAARSIGDISRPHFPDGEVGQPNGPFSRPITQFNPFATGLQVALIKANLLQHAQFVHGTVPATSDTAQQCTNVPAAPTGQKRLADGMQIFAGAVPIYRGNVLVGAVGASGDGIDQDDMISFLGLNNGGLRVGTIGNAATAIRADTIVIPVGAGVRLLYVNCPIAPFLNNSNQNVCQGL